MALVAKQGVQQGAIFDSKDGAKHTDAYAMVVSPVYDAKFSKTVMFRVYIYHDEDARNGGKSPLNGGEFQFTVSNWSEEVDEEVVEHNDFDTYFDESVLKQADKTITSQCYEYLKKENPGDFGWASWFNG